MPQPAALWPSPRNVLRQRLAIFSNEYYQIIATHLPTPKGWKAELASFLQSIDLTPFWQTSICGFSLVPGTTLLVYLFQLVPVIFICLVTVHGVCIVHVPLNGLGFPTGRRLTDTAIKVLFQNSQVQRPGRSGHWVKSHRVYSWVTCEKS